MPHLQHRDGEQRGGREAVCGAPQVFLVNLPEQRTHRADTARERNVSSNITVSKIKKGGLYAMANM